MSREPIHTSTTSYYKIIRPCLWFAVGEKVPTEKFREYYTQTAVKSLIKYGFILIGGL